MTITGFLFFVTAGLWVATLRLARQSTSDSLRQADETKESLRIASESAISAGKAAWASEKSVKEMRQNAKHQLRAYVALEGIHLRDFPVTNRIVIKAKNYGQTPARDLAVWIKSGEGSVTEPITAPQMLHPSQVVTQTANVMGQDGTPTGQFVVSGVMSYRDAFDKWWATRFRYRYEGKDASDFVPSGDGNNEDGPYESRPA